MAGFDAESFHGAIQRPHLVILLLTVLLNYSSEILPIGSSLAMVWSLRNGEESIFHAGDEAGFAVVGGRHGVDKLPADGDGAVAGGV